MISVGSDVWVSLKIDQLQLSIIDEIDHFFDQIEAVGSFDGLIQLGSSVCLCDKKTNDQIQEDWLGLSP